MREMGTLAGVPIEPQEQTDLLDACISGAGVIGGGVPGGGFQIASSLDEPRLIITQLGVMMRYGCLCLNRSSVKLMSCPQAESSVSGQIGRGSTCRHSPRPKVLRRACGWKMSKRLKGCRK